MLKLRRGTVVQAHPARGPEQDLLVELEDGARRPAIADVGLFGRSEAGDEVIVNVQARDLGLGSGGFDIVHVNLTRGLAAEGDEGPAHPHVMKLNYTSLQHAVDAGRGGPDGRTLAGAPPSGEQAGGGIREGTPSGAHPEGHRRAGGQAGERLELPLERPVGVLALHGQLAAVAWAFAQARPDCRLGFVQTPGGALPGGHSRIVRTLRERGLLAGHLTAGAAYGGEGEAVTHRRGAAPRVAHAGLGRGRVRPGAGDRRVELSARPRGNVRARLRSHGARARRPHAARGAHVLGRPAPAPRASPTTR